MVQLPVPSFDGRGLHALKRFVSATGRTAEIDGDGGALLGQPDRNRLPDALRRAGDERVAPDQARGDLRRKFGLLHHGPAIAVRTFSHVAARRFLDERIAWDRSGRQ